MSDVVKAREIIAAFRSRARREREAVGGFWTDLAADLERRLLRRMGWTR